MRNLHNDSLRLLPRRLLPAGLGQAGEEGQALVLPLPALAAAQALWLLPLCPAHGVWRSLGKHLGMDSSLSTHRGAASMQTEQTTHLVRPGSMCLGDRYI